MVLYHCFDTRQFIFLFCKVCLDATIDNMNTGSRPARTLGHVFLFFFGCAVVLATVAPLASGTSHPLQELYIGAAAGFGAFGLTLLFVRWDGLRLRDIGASPDRRSPMRFFFGFAIGLLLIAAHSAVLWGAGHVRWVRAPDIGFCRAFLSLIAYFFLSIREELAFHGYPLRRFVSSYGLWPATIIVALVFAVEHMLGGLTLRQALIGPGLGSVVFGLAAIAARGLAFPIGLHAAWNFGDWMRGGKDAGGFWREAVQHGYEDHAAFTGNAAYIVIMGIMTCIFWSWCRSNRKSDLIP